MDKVGRVVCMAWGAYVAVGNSDAAVVAVAAAFGRFSGVSFCSGIGAGSIPTLIPEG